MNRLAILLSLALASVAGAQPYYVLPSGPMAYDETTRALNLYVETTGADTNDCLSTLTPCLTIEAARKKVPKVIKHQVTITVGLGTFTAGAWLSNIQVAYPSNTTGSATLAAGAGLTITGTMQSVTPTTGSATGTASSATAGSGKTWGTLVKTAAGWTVSDFVGKFLTITGGTGVGQTRVIKDNTADTLSIVGVWRTVPDATSTFAIQEPGTTITGVVQRGAIYVQDTTTLFPQLDQAAFAVDGSVSQNIVAASAIIIQRFKITGVRALYSHSDANVTFRWNRLERSDTPSSETQLILPSGPSTMYVYGNSVVVSGGGTSLINFVDQTQGGHTRLLNVDSNYVLNANEGVGVVSGAVVNVQSNFFKGQSLGFHWGTISQGQSAYNQYRNGTWCMRGDKNNEDGTFGSMNIVDDTFDTCSYGVYLRGGNGYTTFSDVSGSTMTGIVSAGVHVVEGGTVRISSTLAITSAGAEMEMDTFPFTLADVRAASPMVIYDFSYGTRIFQR